MEEAIPYDNELIRLEPLYIHSNLDTLKARDVITHGIRSWSQKDVIYKEWVNFIVVSKAVL